ncbi:hypothetical protein [Corynebacterium freiburgense]|uniref:hypothetical protein n=1 Tax=Corynebacterium freiburgense TaxID=556548 RepID=UPI0003F9D014|nr:hypothetical protein [Corynebacterium freiburgense]WJZ03935.1 hypothetical protein CFREI_13435 [Corynebacterium freiburgense]
MHDPQKPNHEERFPFHPENDLPGSTEISEELRRAIELPTGKEPSEQITDDPLERLERNQSSTRQAIAFAIAVPVVTFLTAFIIAIISRTSGGPLCDAGISDWICSRQYEILFPIIPGVIALSGTLLAAWITYVKWRSYGRWRPWLAIIWVLMPFTLAWMTGFGTMLIIGQR